MANQWSNFPIFTARNGQIKVFPIYMEPQVNEYTDLYTGGAAPYVIYLNGQLTAYYPPSHVYTIQTDGDAHVTAFVDGLLTAEYHPAPYGLLTTGAADVTTAKSYVGAGSLVFNGTVPVVYHNEGTGVDLYDYAPSLVYSISVEGDAHVTVSLNGILSATYAPPPYGVILGGAAQVVTVIDGVDVYDYITSGGIVTGGAADVTVTLLEEQRGGKGTPRYNKMRIQKQRTIFIYEPHAYFENTKALGGEATAYFIPAKFSFIKSLPRLPRPEEITDADYQNLYTALRQTKPETYSYASDGKLSIGGNAGEDYFDFTNFIIQMDDEYIIADILSSKENPFITTTFDRDMSERIKRDDDELLLLV